MSNITPFHGHAYDPPTRAVHAIQYWTEFQEDHANELEGGKNFPDTVAGQAHYEGTDVWSETPPADGLILSGGRSDIRKKLNYTDQQLKEEGKQPWPRISVKASQELTIKWKYTAPHPTRGYIAFITKDGWDPSAPVTRSQLEEKPFFEDVYTEAPYWSYPLPAKDEHKLIIPAGKSGYHVVVLIWLVADTGNAFYQTYDLDISA
ncbi:lytic polysaccharide monooxygenase [Jejubacter calystegiae]|uniref:Lytic polysaccharide monooxygenase n=1 Tax=Jejubacter calystegiae TaxID=2579935 RepID=A0A4P8YND6_9ENTR|nr:lytic polysaccharide monooxygenase auxiliary activity family 9 protein [Jejubacter calystegiae]QCT21733.1 lytic polysaccharide monooxygenase [Jejubacter calystegiae]